MRKIIIFILGGIVVDGAYAALPIKPDICYTAQDFMTTCPHPGIVCCATGEIKHIYSCPSGWDLNSDKTECVRSPDPGSDETGDYELRYGNCTPDVTTETCCKEQAGDASSNCFMCESDYTGQRL